MRAAIITTETLSAPGKVLSPVLVVTLSEGKAGVLLSSPELAPHTS